MPERAISVFNTENTVFPDLTLQIALDLEAVDLVEPFFSSPPEDMDSGGRRTVLLEACRGLCEEDLSPLLERVRYLAPVRLAGWAEAVFEDQIAKGQQVALISGNTPGFIVQACAEGLQPEFETKILSFGGAELVTEDGKFTGEMHKLKKGRYIRGIAGVTEFDIIADSFAAGMPALKYASHPVLVSPEAQLKSRTNLAQYDLINGHGQVVNVRKAGHAENQDRTFDLNTVDGYNAFLEALNTPPYRIES